MKQLFFLFSLALLYTASSAQSVKPKSSKDLNGYTYTYFENTPLNCRIYTLSNGLTVFLNKNTDAPQIETYITVKAGSTYDPKDNTGLAHYLEHMMFKGSNNMGTVNWEKEKPLIQEISDLYEKHKVESDTSVKKEIYAHIDSISQLASQYAVPNEYDKLVSEIGAKNTNAYTSFERTVFINTIPSNELERFLKIERERFGNLVLRLFHTELETVYEEFNMSQDNDFRKGYYALLNAMFPTHQYGTQTTIGKAEHLKNPSMEAIHNYWNAYYIPNNMAISLSGDLDFERAIQQIDATLGTLEKGSQPNITPITEQTIEKPIERNVYGPNAEFLFLGYRTKGASSANKYKLALLEGLLYNGTAGLIDLNLNKSQKVLSAQCGTITNKDYGILFFNATPRDGQTLEEVKDLIVEQIEKVKKGAFEDWQIDAYINNLTLQRMKDYESNGIAHSFAENFANGIDWDTYLNFINSLKSITKKEIIDFTKNLCNNNYAVVYKRTGIDSSVVKVNKPGITPIEINRSNQSEFAKKIGSIESPAIEPEFIDFKEKINSIKLKDGIDYKYVRNEDNERFNLYYVFEMGKAHDSLLPLAVNYLKYIGTSKYSSEQLALELFKYGLNFNVHTTDDMSYVYISGIQSSFDKGIELLEHILSEATVDQTAYDNLIAGILKSRADAKLDKGTILRNGLYNYGKYGSHSKFTDIIPETSLLTITPSSLIDKINNICSYPHEIFYYGPEAIQIIKDKLIQSHTGTITRQVPPEKKYPYAQHKENSVFFVNYDMVQTNVLMIDRKCLFHKDLLPYSSIYNNYYGTSMSSVVFQTIRETKGLAYQTYSYYSNSNEKDDNNYLLAYVGTSPDKMSDAISAMKDLHTHFMKDEMSFGNSKKSFLKQYESQRIIKENIYFTYLSNKKRGIDYDYRKAVYETAKTLTLQDIESFFNNQVKTSNFIYLVLGNKSDIDFTALEKLGTVTELSLETIFGY